MGTATGSVYFDGFPPQGRSGGSLKSEFLPPPAFVPVSETTGLPRAVDILQAAGSDGNWTQPETTFGRNVISGVTLTASGGSNSRFRCESRSCRLWDVIRDLTRILNAKHRCAYKCVYSTSAKVPLRATLDITCSHRSSLAYFSRSTCGVCCPHEIILREGTG
jgi:hypothetical protein